MSKYVIDDKKVFETFLRNDANLKKGLFPIMSKFEREEMDFWIRSLNKYVSKSDKIIEMGCGSGRILKKMKSKDYDAVGFDNNPLFVEYCRRQALNVFLFDLRNNVAEEHRHKYKVIGIALNTLFNFKNEARKKWIDAALEFGTKDCFLLFSVYLDNEFARTTIEERTDYFRAAIIPPSNYKLEFFDNGNERGFHLLTPEGKLEWYSLWMRREELLEEIGSWQRFEIEAMEPMTCGIAYNILLKRKSNQ